MASVKLQTAILLFYFLGIHFSWHFISGTSSRSLDYGARRFESMRLNHRTKKQTSSCSSEQFTCEDRGCIDQDELCDGSPNCKDGSDETARACSTFNCPSYLFSCRYGACVDGDARCDGKTDCADGSDEDPNVCISSPLPTSTTQRPLAPTITSSNARPTRPPPPSPNTDRPPITSRPPSSYAEDSPPLEDYINVYNQPLPTTRPPPPSPNTDRAPITSRPPSSYAEDSPLFGGYAGMFNLPLPTTRRPPSIPPNIYQTPPTTRLPTLHTYPPPSPLPPRWPSPPTRPLIQAESFGSAGHSGGTGFSAGSAYHSQNSYSAHSGYSSAGVPGSAIAHHGSYDSSSYFRDPILKERPTFGSPTTYGAPVVSGNSYSRPKAPFAERPASVATRSRCLLPIYPVNGYYLAVSNGFPGDRRTYVEIFHTCDENYSLVGKTRNRCYEGFWEYTTNPVCERKCKPLPTRNAECFRSFNSSTKNSCDFPQDSRTVAIVSCNDSGDLSVRTMLTCLNGKWNGEVAACARSQLVVKQKMPNINENNKVALNNERNIKDDPSIEQSESRAVSKNATSHVINFGDGSLFLEIKVTHEIQPL